MSEQEKMDREALEKARLIDDDELEAEIREKLLTGWILVSGDIRMISHLEREVYPPGTVKNGDFCAIVGPRIRDISSMGVIYLACKNEDLRVFLNTHFDLMKPLSDEEFELMFELELFQPMGGYVSGGCLGLADPTSASRSIAEIAKEMFKK